MLCLRDYRFVQDIWMERVSLWHTNHKKPVRITGLILSNAIQVLMIGEDPISDISIMTMRFTCYKVVFSKALCSASNYATTISNFVMGNFAKSHLLSLWNYKKC
jgi:hypothetical protein